MDEDERGKHHRRMCWKISITGAGCGVYVRHFAEQTNPQCIIIVRRRSEWNAGEHMLCLCLCLRSEMHLNLETGEWRMAMAQGVCVCVCLQ